MPGTMATASESSVSADITENLLQCPICHSQFLRPKVLSCQHSFCTKCLKGWLQTRTKKTNGISCAVCRKTTILPDRGVDDLPENHVIKGLVSLLKPKDSKPGSAKPEAFKKKSVPTKKAPKKAAAKPVVAAPAKTTPKPKEKKGEAIAAKAAKRRSMPVAANTDAGSSTSKRDKNANIAGQCCKKTNKVAESSIAGQCSKKTNKAAEKNNAGQCSKKTSKVAESSIAVQCSKKTNKPAERNIAGQCCKKSTAEKKMRLYFEDDSDSSSEESDFSSDEDDETGTDDSELTVGSSEDSWDESGEESDVPATPTLKNYDEVNVGMKVYVFSKRGKRVSATVKLLEACEIGESKERRTYAGIELRREHNGLAADDLEDIEGSYLWYWLGENDNPCTVVRADACVPAAMVEDPLES